MYFHKLLPGYVLQTCQALLKNMGPNSENNFSIVSFYYENSDFSEFFSWQTDLADFHRPFVTLTKKATIEILFSWISPRICFINMLDSAKKRGSKCRKQFFNCSFLF